MMIPSKPWLPYPNVGALTQYLKSEKGLVMILGSNFNVQDGCTCLALSRAKKCKTTTNMSADAPVGYWIASRTYMLVWNMFWWCFVDHKMKIMRCWKGVAESWIWPRGTWPRDIEKNLDIMDSNQTFGNLGLSDITAEFDMPGLVLEQGTGANWGAFSTPATFVRH